MRKIVYWVAEINTDSSCYNIRARTKRECLAMVNSMWNKEDYSSPHKVTIQYQDCFDLLSQALSEDSIYEGV